MVAYGCLFSGFRYICNTFTQVAHTEILLILRKWNNPNLLYKENPRTGRCGDFFCVFCGSSTGREDGSTGVWCVVCGRYSGRRGIVGQVFSLSGAAVFFCGEDSLCMWMVGRRIAKNVPQDRALWPGSPEKDMELAILRVFGNAVLFVGSVGWRRHSGMFLKITSEKWLVREIQIIGNLLDVHRRIFQ